MNEKEREEKKREEAFVDGIIEGLDRSSAELAPGVLRRLARSRALALEEGERRGGRGGRGWRRRFTRGAMAGLAAASVAVVAFLALQGGPASVRGYDVVEDVDLLASADRLELLEEMDFYAWLAEREGNGDIEG